MVNDITKEPAPYVPPGKRARIDGVKTKALRIIPDDRAAG